LDAILWHRTAVASFSLAPPRPLQNLLAVPDECPMDGVGRERQIVLPDQLIAQLLDPEPPLSVKRQDEGFLIGKDLLSG
jgi:hypothetical protein